ncbi:hypothetical protein NEOLEDRAFT_1159537 [Neolentinus lepideus HHB14362 ss-1]|uniref:Amino acid transporter n=1 Tax=Neolentinus lepideus HHB14362 ss-1 TaxID=1314782 RepID=A0A165MB94_9AGAM|nr:hypothetical protein NEOLEDRAFT_1159537 [Neolentinus lepideus HHB14362 ss-1]
MKNKDQNVGWSLRELGSKVTGKGRDNDHLVSLGHKPELRRVHGFWSSNCNIVLYSYIFELGGPMMIVAIGQLLVMASLAEYCVWPTAGGQQYYVQAVTPEHMRWFLSYVVGCSSCALNSAQIVAASVQVANPVIEWKVRITPSVSAGLRCPNVSNLAPRYLPYLNALDAFKRLTGALRGPLWNIGSGLTWATVFLVMAPKQDAAFVFTKAGFINESGWDSSAWVFILSMYVPIYGLYGSDGVMHMVEEMSNPSRDAPRVMCWSMVWAGVTAWISAVIMCFTCGDYNTYLAGEQSYLLWFMDITHSVYGGGVFCALIMLGLNYFIIVNMNTAGSRLAWSMAKDGAFPTTFHLPLRTMVAILIIDWAVGLVLLGSDLAFYAIISTGGVTLQLAYCVPILCVVLRGRSILPPRPHFDLGSWGLPINIVSLLWSVTVILFYIFPQFVPVTGNIENMNWAIALLAGIVVFAGIHWAFKGGKEYLVNSNIVLDDSEVVGEEETFSGREALRRYDTERN